MEIIRYEDPAAYAARVRPLLVANEPENCLLLGIVGALELAELSRRERGDAAAGPAHRPLLWSIEEDGACVAAALRTPPHNVVVSRAPEAAARALVQSLVAGSLEVPGFLAPSPTAAVLGGQYAVLTGHEVRRARAERIYALERVRDDWLPAGARAPEGRARLAVAGEAPLLQRWTEEFQTELLLPHRPPPTFGVEGIARQQLWVWEREGRPVSLARWSGRTPNGARIGPVYTPPEERGHGYASGCVAALCRDRLRAGRRLLFLFTDLANPTSNHIYQEIGFEPVCDVDEMQVVGFRPPGDS